jgi:MFS family permease
MVAQRDFKLFFVGRTASALGDWLLQIALPLYVYSRSGSTTLTALTFLSATFPGLLLGPVAGALVDRWDRRRTMLFADLSRAGVLAILLGDPSGHLIWMVFLVVAAQGCLSQLFIPAQNAVLPALVPADQVVAGNTVIAAGAELALLAGPVLGGLIYAVAGLRLSVGLDIATYVLSAVTIVGIRSRTFRRPEASETNSRLHSVLADLVDGVRFTAKHRALRSLLVVSMISFLGGGLLRVLIVPFARDHLHASGTEYGAIISAQAVGGVLGALVAKRCIQSIARARIIMSASLLFVAAAVAALALTKTWTAAGGCLAFGGIPTSVCGILTITLLQTLPTDSHRGRLLGLYQATSALGLVIGAPVAGFLASSLGSFGSIETAAAVFAASGVIALVTFPSSIGVKHLETASDGDAAPS